VNDQPAERTIPILPCRSIDDQLAFYAALGFEATYRQKAPNVYAAVQRGGIELQFFVLSGYDPASSYSTCYVYVADVDTLYAEFRDGLKRALGRIPTRGIPRIGALKDMSYGVRQFLLTDPGSNIIRLGQALEIAARRTDEPRSRLEKALEAASLLADSRSDPETAARVLDAAFSATADAPAALLVRARVLRADVALAMGDTAKAAALLEEVDRTTLAADERATAEDELARAGDLRRSLV
jgi:hypothetical protein